MAFIGVLLVCLLMLAAFLAVVGLVLFLIAVGVTAIISSVVLANTGKKLSESKRKKTLVIVLLIDSNALNVSEPLLSNKPKLLHNLAVKIATLIFLNTGNVTASISKNDLTFSNLVSSHIKMTKAAKKASIYSQ